MLVFSGGISAIEANNYHNLYAVLVLPRYREYCQGAYDYAIQRLNTAYVFEHNYNSVPITHADRDPAAASNYIFAILREKLKEYIPDDAKFNDIFDIFEYIQSIVYRDLINDEFHPLGWSPLGRFAWRYRLAGGIEHSQIAEFLSTGEKGTNWELLKARSSRGLVID